MIRFFLIIFLCLTAFSQLLSQDIPKLSIIEQPGLIIKNTTDYNSETLFDYIDGGADIYLEYGFQSLVTQEVSFDNQELTVEIYRMKDREGAFGIFSVNRIDCDAAGLLNMPIWTYCSSPYMLHFAVNNFYIRIMNSSGEEIIKIYSKRIAEVLLKKIPNTFYKLPDKLNQPFFTDNLKEKKFFRGKLGLQNGLLHWAAFFEKSDTFNIHFIKFTQNSNTCYIAQVEMPSAAEMEKFKKYITTNKIMDGNIPKFEKGNELVTISSGTATTFFIAEINPSNEFKSEIMREIFITK